MGDIINITSGAGTSPLLAPGQQSTATQQPQVQQQSPQMLVQDIALLSQLKQNPLINQQAVSQTLASDQALLAQSTGGTQDPLAQMMAAMQGGVSGTQGQGQQGQELSILSQLLSEAQSGAGNPNQAAQELNSLGQLNSAASGLGGLGGSIPGLTPGLQSYGTGGLGQTPGETININTGQQPGATQGAPGLGSTAINIGTGTPTTGLPGVQTPLLGSNTLSQVTSQLQQAIPQKGQVSTSDHLTTTNLNGGGSVSFNRHSNISGGNNQVQSSADGDGNVIKGWDNGTIAYDGKPQKISWMKNGPNVPSEADVNATVQDLQGKASDPTKQLSQQTIRMTLAENYLNSNWNGTIANSSVISTVAQNFGVDPKTLGEAYTGQGGNSDATEHLNN